MFSHVQVPKSMLKRFSDQHGTLYCYECKSDQIRKTGAGKLNTIEDYYSGLVETELSKTIEAKLGRAIVSIEEADYENPNFILSLETDGSIRGYARSLIARSPKQHKDISNSAVFFSELPEQQQHDFATLGTIDYMNKQGFFDSMIMTIMINKTVIPFVLPMFGMYEIGIEGKKLVVIPITSWIAVLLFTEELRHLVIHSGGKALYMLVDEDIVKKV